MQRRRVAVEPLPIQFHEVVTVVRMNEPPLAQGVQEPYEVPVERKFINNSHLHELPVETYFHHVTLLYDVPTRPKNSRHRFCTILL